MDESVYNNIFSKEFTTSPAISDYQKLATLPFSKTNHKLLRGKESTLFTILKTLFQEQNFEVKLYKAEDIILGEMEKAKIQSINKLSYLIESM